MTQAISATPLPIAIELQAFFGENGVEQHAVRFREDAISWMRSKARKRRLQIGRTGRAPLRNALKRKHRARHALAVTSAALATHIDMQDRLLGIPNILFHDFHISKFKPVGFIGPKAGVHHEEDVVVKVFTADALVQALWVFRAFARGAIELLVFLRKEPGPTIKLTGFLVGLREIGDRIQPCNTAVLST